MVSEKEIYKSNSKSSVSRQEIMERVIYKVLTRFNIEPPPVIDEIAFSLSLCGGKEKSIVIICISRAASGSDQLISKNHNMTLYRASIVVECAARVWSARRRRLSRVLMYTYMLYVCKYVCIYT